MKGFVQDIEAIAVKNEDFRQVLYTAKNCQLVVMALKPKEAIVAFLKTLTDTKFPQVNHKLFLPLLAR